MATFTAQFEQILRSWARDLEMVPEVEALAVVEEAQALLAAAAAAPAPASAAEIAAWHLYLERTAHPRFLLGLPDRTWRERWAETTFSAIDRAHYDLEVMLQQRVRAHPQRILFQESAETGGHRWSYERIARRLREIAAVLCGTVSKGTPKPGRVAIYADNSLGGACCDLACLCHGIFVTPLDIHFDSATLTHVLERVHVDTVVTDSVDRLERLQKVRENLGRELKVLLLDADVHVPGAAATPLAEEVARLVPAEIAARLAALPAPDLHQVATVMFTSGSTGMPKAVAFTLANLITKRFARSAALPEVGRDEVLLCYLPLFHTFGRYLEMLGTIYWGGTYVFAGNPSAETLLLRLQQIRPTGLISIPLRWMQIYERCLRQMSEVQGEREQQAAVREVVGGRLSWGLSAAGYLDPQVFRFFHRHGVAVNSGFGMTEATGGITMTPPDDYREGSVGLPLPGVQARLSDAGELQIRGPYIARYLEDVPVSEGGERAEPAPEDDPWLATGDLFQIHEGGHYEIVDRLKDIYKNNKGQTIAPRKVEQKFTGVPGVRRTFLVGDGRAYNTLLIVPDRQDPLLSAASADETLREYFHQIITAANRDLAPYERVVNFALLDRDFSLERGELTPKASYRRKAIEQNFAGVIQELYLRDTIELAWQDLRVRLPRWIFRDLGILETDIAVTAAGLRDRVNGNDLTLGRGTAAGRVQVGDLEYQLEGDVLDLGTFARQPLLWGGNPALHRFCPCKEGWDVPLGPVAEQVFLPAERRPAAASDPLPPCRTLPLAGVLLLCQQALFGPEDNALAAVEELAKRLQVAGSRLGTLVRRRLEALACHPSEPVRCRAYHILVLDEPAPDYNRYLPAFIHSGRTFLCEDSIAAIARSSVEPRRLQAFRQRLHSYRTQLPWPAAEPRRQIFDDLFRLLADFARYHPEFYGPIREELVAWLLHDRDPELARCARRHFDALATDFETRLASESPALLDVSAWEGKIAFQDGLSEPETERLRQVLVGTTFLKQSVLLACEGESFELDEIGPGGIWISRILSWHMYSRYRVSINTREGKHLDLQLIIREDLDQDWVLETIFWLIAIRGHPYGVHVLPAFGCCRPELGAISLAYQSDLTVWERVREWSSQGSPEQAAPPRDVWRRLFVRAMATVFTGWRNSGGRIVPGTVSPSNIVVPAPDFRESSLIQSLTGWRRYADPLSLVRPLLRNFYRQTISHYPWLRPYLDETWICEACAEAVGPREAVEFLDELLAKLAAEPLPEGGPDFTAKVKSARDRLQRRYYVPLPLQAAIDRYGQWERVNAQATSSARLEQVEELVRLYRLDRFPEIARYTLFRHTYFARADLAVQDVYDRLLVQLFRRPERRATQLVELSDLQAALIDMGDRRAFRRLAFPRGAAAQQLEVTTVGDREQERVIVRSRITDRFDVSYQVSEPTQAAQVGQVYRLFLLGGFPKTISEQDRFLMASDAQERIVGGVCYQLLPGQVVHLDGIAVTRSLHDRGITSALLEDFCARMADLGIRAVRTHFFLRAFYQKRGFRTDQRWGGLVRFLGP